MSKTKDVLKHVSVEIASARRKCYHKPKQHSIAKGESCLVVVDKASRAKRNYCEQCAAEIIELAETNIKAAKGSLGIAG